MNCQYSNIKFTFEIKENNTILFLDIKSFRENNSSSTLIYRKPTFNGVFKSFESLTPLSYKSNLLNTLLFRAFNLCSSFERFQQEK